MTNFKRLIVVTIIAFLAACAGIACWSGITPSGPGIEATSYSFNAANPTKQSQKTFLTIALDTFNSQALSGQLSYNSYDSNDIQKIQEFQQAALYIGKNPANDPNGLYADLKLQKDVPNGVHLETDNFLVPLNLNGRHGDFYYPFDGYCITITPKIEIFDSMKLNGEAANTAEIDVGNMNVIMDLPNRFRTRRNLVPKKGNASASSCKYTSAPISERPPGEQDIDIFIDHPWWFRSIILMLITVLLIPTILTFRKTADVVGMDILTGLASIGSVRSFIFGTELTVHFLDIVMGGFLMVIMIIPLVKWGWSSGH